MKKTSLDTMNKRIEKSNSNWKRRETMENKNQKRKHPWRSNNLIPKKTEKE